MSHPHVVVVVMDTARARAVEQLTADGDDFFTGLGRAGRTYTNAISASPWTLPSHASLFTGTYPSKHGAHADHKRLSGGLPVLPEAFADVGYETVAVSNNTWISEEFGFGRGFETFYKTWQYVQSDTDLGEVARTTEGRDQLRSLVRTLREGNPLVNLANAFYGKYLRKRADDGARQTNDWLRGWLESRDSNRPYFFFVNYLEPHLEYRPSREVARQHLPADVSFDDAMAVPQDAWGYLAGTVDLDDRDFEALQGLYRAEIAYLARRLAELRATLDTHEADRDTVFILTSDHGENIGDHGLMDHQYSLHDTLLRVPLVIAGPGFEANTTSERLVQLVDLVPTLLDAADLDAPAIRETTQGRSFHPGTGTPPREFAFAEYLAPQPSMAALERRVGSLPEVVRRFDRSLRAVRTADRKFIRGSDGTRWLYDLTVDPDETEDRSGVDGEAATSLEDRLDDWLESFEPADHTGDVSIRPDTRDRLERLGYLQ